MTDPVPRGRVPAIVTGVLRDALRTSGRAGFAIPGPLPEDALVKSWLLEGEIPWASPSLSALGQARDLLTSRPGSSSSPAPPAPLSEPGPSRATPGHGSLGPAQDEMEESSWEIAGLALAASRNLLLLDSTNKTCLLLSPRRPVAPVLPLGDVYASEVLDLWGDCTRPAFLKGEPEATLRAVDAALSDYFEGGLHRNEAFRRLPDAIREGIERGLDAARRYGRFLPRVPKLGYATLGVDLDL